MSEHRGFYDSTYSRFAEEVYAAIRREAFGEDIGQNSWLTAGELRDFLRWLGLNGESHVLEVACGSGGPALFMVQETGCRVTGVDVNENAIATASRAAQSRGLDSRAQFQKLDASVHLPFDDCVFHAILCIDAINHLPGRPGVLREWRRVLKPGGSALFTDPITITGILTNEEIAARSSLGFFLFTPLGENERLLMEAGLELLRREDATQNVVLTSGRWREARERRRHDLLKIEGETAFEKTQRFLQMVCTLAAERRLSRFVYHAARPAA